MAKLEIIAFNIQSCKAIQDAGAGRIELCDNPTEGGTTPSYGLIKAARKTCSIQLFPIIRPRGGDFFYTDAEFEVMLSDVAVCKSLGCDGIVTGMLNRNGSINRTQLDRVVHVAYPMTVCFHRAFDRASDHRQAIVEIIDAGCERILTSGGFPDAVQGAANIAEWIKTFGNDISFMPGSGVRANNLEALMQQTGATEYHSSARTLIPGNIEYQNPNIQDKNEIVSVDKIEIEKMLRILNR